MDVPTDVIRTISPRDQMAAGRGRTYYFIWGPAALACIRLAMQAVGKEKLGSILDFGCGHGRVLRYIRAAFSEAHLTACDLDRDGVDFCVEMFGATGVYSSPRLAEIAMPRESFDLIWAGSVFTHVDSPQWQALLPLLSDLLKPEGLLVFTAHGPLYAGLMREGRAPFGMAQALQAKILASYDTTGFG